jgi:PST family polysaccharide transporter
MTLITKFVQYSQNPVYRKIVGNIFSLSGLQVANSLLPLITIPYVVRVIGPSNFGLISFAQAFAAYFLLMVNYGFDLSASRKISVLKSEQSKLAEVFWSVLSTKILLFLFSTIIFLLLLFTVSKLHENISVIAVSYLLIVGFVLFPTWLFQGVEKLGVTALFNFFVKLIFTVGVFLFVKSKGDFILVPLFLTAGQFVAGFFAFLYGWKKIIGKFEYPTLRSINECLREGWGVFLSVIFINLYTTTNIVLLGFFTSADRVGYFSGAAKIVLAVNMVVLYPISQSLYPHSIKIISQGSSMGTAYIKRLAIIVSGISLPISLLLLIFASNIVHIILGSQYEPAIVVVRLLSFFPFIIGLSNIFGIQGVLGLQRDRVFLNVIVVGAIVNLVLNIVLDPIFSEIGSSIAWLVTEIYITVGLFIALHSAGLEIFDLTQLKKYFGRSIRKIEI